jgi:2-C-methyl-D-erythritol 2,4-cyclodiphosphate synthase
MADFRIGHGYDVHKLVSGRRLVLGGVEIPHTLGLLGHSDADVLLHAIMDAILGALGAGDIGRHFPDNSDEYKDISSMTLLVKTKDVMQRYNAKIVNIDSTVVLQKPKVMPYIEKMRQNIAFALECDVSRVNVKATTEEHLGFTGREEGVSAHSVVLLEIENKAPHLI